MKYKAIAKSYARLIKYNRKKFSEVPNILKESVKAILEEHDLGHLAVEEEKEEKEKGI